MDPSANEGATEGEGKMTMNNSFRALNEDFNEAIQPSNTNTALRAMHGTSGKGTPTRGANPAFPTPATKRITRVGKRNGPAPSNYDEGAEDAQGRTAARKRRRK